MFNNLAYTQKCGAFEIWNKRIIKEKYYLQMNMYVYKIIIEIKCLVNLITHTQIIYFHHTSKKIKTYMGSILYKRKNQHVSNKYFACDQ